MFSSWIAPLLLPAQTCGWRSISVTLGIQLASPSLSQDWRQSSEKKHWWEGKFAIYISSVVSALQHKFLGHDIIISTSQIRKLRFQDIEKLACVYICGSRGDSQG